jgi:hypothetical protein
MVVNYKYKTMVKGKWSRLNLRQSDGTFPRDNRAKGWHVVSLQWVSQSTPWPAIYHLQVRRDTPSGSKFLTCVVPHRCQFRSSNSVGDGWMNEYGAMVQLYWKRLFASTQRISPSAILSTVHSTGTVLGSKPVACHERPASTNQKCDKSFRASSLLGKTNTQHNIRTVMLCK